MINKKLLPIKLHYFLRYAGSTFMIMVFPLIVRQKGVSAQGVGFLWAIMPIVSLITSSVSGAFADYFRAHRSVFLLSLILLTSSLLAVYVTPNLPEPDKTNSIEILQDLQPHSSYLDHSLSITISPLRESKDFNNLTVQTFLSSNESHLRTEIFTHWPRNLTASAVQTATDKLLKLGDPELIIDGGQVLPPDYISEDTSSISYLMKFPQFWLIFFAVMIEQIGIGTCVMITDAVCFQILGTERHKYGQQRLWGTTGMGILCIVSGALVDLYSKGLPHTDYLPAAIICIVLMVCDMGLVAKMNIPSSKEKKVNMGEVWAVLIHPKTIVFFITVYVMGSSLGVLWVFKLMHIEDVAIAWDPNFSNLKLLQGLDIGIESFGGEIPFFFLSGIIIQCLGHDVVFAGTIGVLALRCCLYFFVSNPWWFLGVELLNGVTYALSHACIASYASHLAPPGAQATLQSVTRASFSTGLSTAGFLGGMLYHSLGGAAMFLSVGIFDACFCVIFIVIQILLKRYCSHKKKSPAHFGYDAPSNNSSSSCTQSEEKSTSDISDSKCREEEEKEEEKEEEEEERKKSLMDNV